MKKINFLCKTFLLGSCIAITNSISAQSVDVKIGDETLKFVPTGRATLDGVVFMDDDTDLDNGVTFSDARLGMIGTYKEWTVKVEAGYSNSKMAMRDIFAKYNFNESSSVQVGHFVEPFGLEYITGAVFSTFISANGASNAFSSDRKIGVQYTNWKDLYWFGGGVFSDAGAMNNDKQGDQGYGVSGRFVFTPIKEKGKFLHIGVAGIANKASANGRDADGSDKHNRIFKFSNSLPIDKTPTVETVISNADYQTKYAVEFIGGLGPVHVQAEYFHSNVNRRSGNPSYVSDGGYAQVGFLARGGDYDYTPSLSIVTRPAPKSIELAARYSYTNLDRAKGGFLADKGGTMSDFSFSANYYVNKYMAVKLGYSYLSMGNNSPILPNQNIGMIQTRCQIVF